MLSLGAVEVSVLLICQTSDVPRPRGARSLSQSSSYLHYRLHTWGNVISLAMVTNQLNARLMNARTRLQLSHLSTNIHECSMRAMQANVCTGHHRVKEPAQSRGLANGAVQRAVQRSSSPIQRRAIARNVAKGSIAQASNSARHGAESRVACLCGECCLCLHHRVGRWHAETAWSEGGVGDGSGLDTAALCDVAKHTEQQAKLSTPVTVPQRVTHNCARECLIDVFAYLGTQRQVRSTRPETGTRPNLRTTRPPHAYTVFGMALECTLPACHLSYG